jgi:acyl dehydratase
MKVGEELPPLERTIELPDMVAYGGATWDWHPMHYDRELTEKGGLPGPVVDGQMFGGLLAKQLIDWLGPRAFITNLAMRYKAMVFAGETVACEGEITEVGEGTIAVAQSVRVGDRLAVEATARVTLDQKARTPQPPDSGISRTPHTSRRL